MSRGRTKMNFAYVVSSMPIRDAICLRHAEVVNDHARLKRGNRDEIPDASRALFLVFYLSRDTKSDVHVYHR